MRVDAVLLYAQRGAWQAGRAIIPILPSGCGRRDALVPVGKAYFGFTDAELKELDRFVRNNTVDRFGPVRASRAKDGGGSRVRRAEPASPRHQIRCGDAVSRALRGFRADKTCGWDEADTL